MARMEAPLDTRFARRLGVDVVDHAFAIDAGQGTQTKAQLVAAKTALLSLELRFDVALIATRPPNSRASLARRSGWSCCICCNGAIASSKRRSEFLGHARRVRGLAGQAAWHGPPRSGTRGQSGSRTSTRARRKFPFAGAAALAATPSLAPSAMRINRPEIGLF